MLLTLLPITLIPTLIMGILVYNRSRSLLLEQISERMEIFITQATNQLDSYLLDRNLAIERLHRDEEFVLDIVNIFQLDPDNPSFNQARGEVLTRMRALNTSAGGATLFNFFLITDVSGNIIISSDYSWQGLNLSSQPYYQDTFLSDGMVSTLEILPAPFYTPDDPNTDVMLLTVMALQDSQGKHIGHLVGMANSLVIQSVLEANASFLPENNVFLLTESQQFAGITDLASMDSLSPQSATSGHLDLANQGPTQNSIARSYTSTDGEQVLGIYSFFAPLNIGFIIETPESRSLQSIDSLAPYAIGMIAGTIVLIGLFIFIAARRISLPLIDLAGITQSFAGGNWNIRSQIDRNDEIGSLATTFNNMADDLSNLYLQMEQQVEERTRQVITATEVSNIATNASNLDELLDQAVYLISDRFNLTHASIYLLDAAKENAQLRSATSSVGQNLIQQGYHARVTTDSIYRWVVRNNLAKYIAISDENPDQLKYNLIDQANAVAIIPISLSRNVFGFIDVQSVDQEKITHNTLDILNTLANQLASAIQNFRLLEGTEVNLQQISQLYQASHKIARAHTEEEVLKAIVDGIQQTTFFAAAYKPVDNTLTLIESTSNKPYYETQLPREISLSGKLIRMFFEKDMPPLIIRDMVKPVVPIRPELFEVAKSLNAQETAFIPIIIDDELVTLIILASRDAGKITQDALEPFVAFSKLITTAIERVKTFRSTEISLKNLTVLTDFSNSIINESDPEKLYPLIHEQIKIILGDVDFYIALYDDQTNHIEIPYLYEGEQPIQIDPFPLGEGLTTIIIRTKQSLMLVENTEERAKALGAKIVGQPARSLIGVPLIVSDKVIGVMNVQDVEHEHRFNEEDLRLLETIAAPIAGAINSTRLIEESQKRAYQLQTSAEISQETSTTLDRDELLKHAIQLVRDRFNFYHASVFLLDPSKEYAVIQESTGEAGRQMISEGHQLKVGSKSVIGYVTEHKKPLVVNDVQADPTHRFNPLLPETRAELGLPIMLGDTLLGALDVQSTTPYAFSPDDIEVLQILANQLAVAITNANLFAETQEHLAQHRLIHHVTTVSASSTNIEDALSSAVQGLRVTLGDYVSILLLDPNKKTLRVLASSGYDQDLIGMQVEVGDGITGWVAEHNEAVIVNDTHKDPRYIAASTDVRSELAVPLVYRGEILGVLNIESETPNAYDEHDQDILGTLAGSLAAIIVNARLSERQQQLFEITNKIRQSVNMGTILETTAEELSKALQARRTRIQIGGDFVSSASPSENGNEGETS